MVYSRPGGPAPCLRPAWDREEWQRPGERARVRLALPQGQAGTPSRLSQLPGRTSQPAGLPPSSRGRQPLIRAYLLPIECFLFVFAAASGKHGVGRPEKLDFQSWGSPRAGDLYSGPPFCGQSCPSPRSAHRTVSAPRSCQFLPSWLASSDRNTTRQSPGPQSPDSTPSPWV